MAFDLILGVDNDLSVECHRNELLDNDNDSDCDQHEPIDDCTMTGNGQITSDDNGNDDDSLCESFYSGELVTSKKHLHCNFCDCILVHPFDFI